MRAGGERQIEEAIKAANLGTNVEEFVAFLEEKLMTKVRPFDEAMKYLLLELGLKPEEKRVQALRRVWEKWVKKAELFPETKKTLVELKRRGFELVILSNTGSEFFNQKLRETGLRLYFKAIIISAEVGVLKPDKRIFSRAEKILECSPSKILMVDDSYYHGVLPARKLGWKGLLVDREGKSKEKMKISNLSEIVDFIKLPQKREGYKNTPV